MCIRDSIRPGVGSIPQATAADMASSIVVRIVLFRICVPTERVSDRTLVRCVARAADKVETRVEQVFETCVRSAYAVCMSNSQTGTSDNGRPAARSEGRHHG